jgi:hypothetical protein
MLQEVKRGQKILQVGKKSFLMKFSLQYGILNSLIYKKFSYQFGSIIMNNLPDFFYFPNEIYSFCLDKFQLAFSVLSKENYAEINIIYYICEKAIAHLFE